MTGEASLTEFLAENPRHIVGVTTVADGRDEVVVGDTETMCAYADWCVAKGDTSWEKAHTLKAFLRSQGGEG